MPSISQEYYAEVPGTDFDIGHLTHFGLGGFDDYGCVIDNPPPHHYPHGAINGPAKPQDSIPVPTKIEPSELFLDYLDTPVPPGHWPYSSLPVNSVPSMSSPYQQTTPPQQLQLSEPPTPAAECQVTSTNLSPIPTSPYSPHSDVSYDGAEGGFSGDFDSVDLSDLNLKGLTEEQLVSLSARDLNRLCRDMPEDIVKQLKKRRRTLKNRGYAYNSRVRRVSQKNALEDERDTLQKQLAQLTERCKLLERESEQWKKRAQALERGEV